MNKPKPASRSYLLRLWWAEDEDETAIRIYIEDPLTAERRGFTNIDELIEFIRKEIQTKDKPTRRNNVSTKQNNS